MSAKKVLWLMIFILSGFLANVSFAFDDEDDNKPEGTMLVSVSPAFLHMRIRAVGPGADSGFININSGSASIYHGNGRVLITEILSEGEYEIFFISFLTPDHRRVKPEKPISIRFSIKGNQVTYLGNLRIISETYGMRFGMKVSDQADVDIQKYKESDPGFKDKQVTTRLMVIKREEAF